jgi:uncharacterized protein (TIGR02996 family)
MTQDDPFLPAILASPDDIALRMAYADWLEDHALAGRAEFIRLQCHCATLPVDDPQRTLLKVRERAALAECAREWFGPILEQFLNKAPAAGTEYEQQQRHAAQKYGVLPLVGDMGGWYGLSMDGALDICCWDSPDEMRIEEDPRLRYAMLFDGCRKYPSVRLLIPPRPVGSKDCEYCDETNRIRSFIPHILCYCGGLGWLPPDD